jgi:hypothetical protein
MVLLKTTIISLNSSNQFIFEMANCGVLFEVRAKFLNIIFGLKWLKATLFHIFRTICLAFIMLR